MLPASQPRPGRRPLCAGREVTPCPSCHPGHEATSFPTGFASSFQGMVRGRRAGAGSSQGAHKAAAGASGPLHCPQGRGVGLLPKAPH